MKKLLRFLCFPITAYIHILWLLAKRGIISTNISDKLMSWEGVALYIVLSDLDTQGIWESFVIASHDEPKILKTIGYKVWVKYHPDYDIR